MCSGSDALGYLWTATNNLVLITGDLARSGQSGYGAGQSETLHWANGQLLFTTNSNGTLDDLKIGQLADITTLPGTSGGKPGLTVWDRQLDGRQTSWHSSAGIGKWLPPDDPTQGYNLAHPDDRGILPVQLPTTDGFTDRHNVFQGARVYDYDANQWTSPDAVAGSLDNPFSFRRYLYDNGNPNSNSDPSGNCTVTATNPPTIGCVDSNKPAPSAAPGADSNNVIGLVVYVIDQILNLFSGLFGGGHGHAPQQPPQAEPANPSGQAAYPDAYRQFTNVGQFANMLGAGAPAVVLAGLTGGTALPALGLGGEIAGAAGVELVEARLTRHHRQRLMQPILQIVK